MQIPPGGAIVVPKNSALFYLSTFTTNIIDLISKIAITAASLAAIGCI